MKHLIPLFVFMAFGLGIPNETLDAAQPGKSRWWSVATDFRLESAGANRAEIAKALQKTPKKQRKGMAFLIANMPKKDLRTLKAAFLLENVDLAYKAKQQTPWGKDIPDEVFLNYVLPYANVDENRHPWRKQFFEMCMPLVKKCETPGEAAHLLNSTVFKIVKVRYSTKRKKPHQSPKESMEIGMASCTGLSIVLADACRSVAVPARLVGTPQWTSVRGNHTWVEIWDKDWHFTGACEPDGRGLNHGWFAGRASQAKKDSKMHAIYAATFAKTGVTFPLVWNLKSQEVPAVNVTDRYTKKKKAKPKKQKLSNEQTARIKEAVMDYFTADKNKQNVWKFDPILDQWLEKHENAVRELVWQAYRTAPIHKELKANYDAKRTKWQNHVSPYTIKNVGKRPKNGWPLFIAMHGGGGVAQKVNDSQWRHMQIYYRDQKSVTGYKYLALRAPNNAWNGFYANYVPPLIVNLIRQFLLYGDVDPDKVYIMGYSHGGYGAFFIGPKIPHRFAAIHVSAAAPSGGAINPLTLRNTRFTYMIGEKDTRYGRRGRCEAFNKQIQQLKGKRTDIFPVVMEFKKGYGHGGLPDRDKIRDMYPYTRNPVPKHLTWAMTDSINKDFFWVSNPNPGGGQSIEAVVKDNTITLTSNVAKFDLWLDGRLVDLTKDVQIVLNGKEEDVEVRHSIVALCRSLAERGDPRLAFVCRVRLGINN